VCVCVCVCVDIEIYIYIPPRRPVEVLPQESGRLYICQYTNKLKQINE